MKYRVYLRQLWWTPQFDDQPTYLYLDNKTRDFNVGCRATASKNWWEFSEEELELLKKMRAFEELFWYETVEEKESGPDE